MDARFQAALDDSERRWAVVEAPLRNDALHRTPAALRAVVAQFDVAHSARYQPIAGKATYCNIFVWDVTRALGCELPHWVDPAGRSVEPGKGTETNCNILVAWLEQRSVIGHGWREVAGETEAGMWAANGGPAIAIWRNPSGKPGHIAVLLPSSDTTARIAQAGKECLFDVPLVEGFGRIYPIRFFTHA